MSIVREYSLLAFRGLFLKIKIMTTTEKNILIAGFMDIEAVTIGQFTKWRLTSSPYSAIFTQSHCQYLDFDKSWEWLMPVVGKIHQLYQKAFPKTDRLLEMLKEKQSPVDWHYMEVVAAPLSTPIEEAFEAIIKFIQWHNSQPNNQK